MSLSKVLKRNLRVAAAERGISMNKLVNQIVEKKLPELIREHAESQEVCHHG